MCIRDRYSSGTKKSTTTKKSKYDSYDDGYDDIYMDDDYDYDRYDRDSDYADGIDAVSYTHLKKQDEKKEAVKELKQTNWFGLSSRDSFTIMKGELLCMARKCKSYEERCV